MKKVVYTLSYFRSRYRSIILPAYRVSHTSQQLPTGAHRYPHHPRMAKIFHSQTEYDFFIYSHVN